MPPRPSPQQNLPKKNVEWASTIKNHHNKIRELVTKESMASTADSMLPAKDICGAKTSNQNKSSASTVPTSLAVGISIDESYERWRAHRDASADALKAYSVAMHDLATRYWAHDGGEGSDVDDNNDTAPSHAIVGEKRAREESSTSKQREEQQQPQFSSTSGRYDDRVQLVVDAAKDFYFGEIGTFSTTENSASEEDASSSLSSSVVQLEFGKYPTIITQQLRALRKRYFEEHQKQLPAEEERGVIQSILDRSDSSAQSSSSSSSLTSHCLEEIVRQVVESVERFKLVVDGSGGVSDGGAKGCGEEVQQTKIALNILDVGSCYGPYRGHFDAIGAEIELAIAKEVTRCMNALGHSDDRRKEENSASCNANTLSSIAERQVAKAQRPFASSALASYRRLACCCQGRKGRGDGAQAVGEEDMMVQGPFVVDATHVDVDLCPYEGSGVYQCDWLECKFHQPESSSSLPQMHASNVEKSQSDDGASSSSGDSNHQGLVRSSPSNTTESTTRSVVSLTANAFHIVIFCFMLSYLPTREMRLRSCYKALRALKMGGLFCVVSTRTQGPRSGKWIEPWTACIEGVGFKIAQKVIKSKVVLLTFQKVRDHECCRRVGEENTNITMDDAAEEAYYREHFLPLLTKYPEGMSLHQQSI